MKKAIVAIGVAVIGMMGAVVGAFITAKAAATAHIDSVNTKVEVLSERQALQYTEVKDSLARIEKKIDKLSPTFQAVTLK